MTPTVCVRWNTCRLTILLGVLAVSALSAGASAEESHPGIGLESMYSEAVLSYNKKQTEETLRILDELLKISPNHVEGLELKALTLKGKGDDQRSADVYARLLRLKPEAERGPYHFELGVILNKLKKGGLARGHFEEAIRLHFNEVTSHLFLGLIHFGNGNMGQSEASFQKVATDGTPELKVVAHYYLGLIHFKNSYGAGGTSEMFTTIALAKEAPESKMAAEIQGAAEKVLAPFKSSQWFGTAAVIGQYDTNISQIPTALASSTGASGIATPTINLSGGLGRLSSPMNMVQAVASYRFSFNYNLNSATQGYEYFTNTGSLYLNYVPLKETSGGLKIEGNFAFQNQPADGVTTTEPYQFGKYYVNGELGPFIRTQLSKRTLAQAEIYFRVSSFFTQTDLSGNAYGTRLSVRGETDAAFFNPGASLSFEKNTTQSAEFQDISGGAGISNRMHLSGADIFTTSVDVLYTPYPSASISRIDATITLHISLIHNFSPKWALLSDAIYTSNISTNAASYTYNRLQLGAGVSMSL